jgi:hypothetical protein
MAGLLAHVLPLALLGALMPTRLTLVTSLLGTSRPRANAIAFSLACTAGYLVTALFSGALRTAATRVTGGGPHSLAPLELALGLALLALLAWMLAGPPRSQQTSPALAGRITLLSPARTSLLGFGLGVTSLRCAAILIEVSTLVVEDGFGRVVLVAVLVLTVLVFSLPMLLPVAAYLLVSDRLLPALASLRRTLERNGHRITVFVTGALGAYLVIRGAIGIDLTGLR